MSRILVTGATGFIGANLCRRLQHAGHEVCQIVRHHPSPGQTAPGSQVIAVGDIAGDVEWHAALRDIDAVAHLAGLAHLRRGQNGDDLASYRRVNVEATGRLAAAAGDAGVKRFLFLSSIGVLGNSTRDRPFSDDTPANPLEDYARSKYEAEQHLGQHANGMELTIVRPPLVYGPGNPGNFLSLLKLVASGLPLPFGRVENMRSLIGVENLVDFLTRCLEDRAAAGRTFLISDGEDISLRGLIELIAEKMHRPVRLFPVPVGLLLSLGRLIGQRERIAKLTAALVIDSLAARDALHWAPPTTLAEGITATVAWYLDAAGGR